MRTHETVLDWVEEELTSGRLVIGGRLPGERVLAEELGVSRSAVREALRVLEAMGVVRSSVGSGPTAGTIVVAEPRTALASALRLHLASTHLVAADVVETRILLESWAAEHSDPSSETLAGAADLVASMAESIDSPVDYLDLDARFHVLLSTAAGNPLIGAMMSALRESIRGYTSRIAEEADDWPALAGRLGEEHSEILAALADGERELAARLLREHITAYFDRATVVTRTDA